MPIAVTSRAHQVHPQPAEWADQRMTPAQQYHLSIRPEPQESHPPPLPLPSIPNVTSQGQTTLVTISVEKPLKVVVLHSSHPSGKTTRRRMMPLCHHHPIRSPARGRRRERHHSSHPSGKTRRRTMMPLHYRHLAHPLAIRRREGHKDESESSPMSPATSPDPNQPKSRGMVTHHVAAPEQLVSLHQLSHLHPLSLTAFAA